MNFESLLRAATSAEAAGPLEAQAVGPTVPCKVASVVWRDAQRRFERISTLVYILLLLALAAIIAAIVLFFAVDDTASAAVVSLVTSLISGGLATFIKDERDKAKDARDAAVNIINEQCGGQSADQVLAAMGA
jgi:O-antigen/teichoic acid export membrane protein